MRQSSRRSNAPLLVSQKSFAFSVSQSNLEEVVGYIENQEEHHKRVTFQDEYRAFLKAYAIEYDERYVSD